MVHADFRARLLDLFAFKLLITLAVKFTFVSDTVTSSVLHGKQTGLIIWNVCTQIAVNVCLSHSIFKEKCIVKW